MTSICMTKRIYHPSILTLTIQLCYIMRTVSIYRISRLVHHTKLKLEVGYSSLFVAYVFLVFVCNIYQLEVAK